MSNSDSAASQANFIQTLPGTSVDLEGNLTIRPGQTDLEIKWALHGINRTDPELAAMIYRARLIDFLNRHHSDTDWADILTPRQREVMLQGRRCKERLTYAKDKGSPVRSYRRNLSLTDDERRAEDAERKRRDRAAKSDGPSKLKTDLSGMTAEEQDEHRRQKARERKQRQRDKKRLTANMTPDEIVQHEHDLEKAEEAKLRAIMTALRE